MINIIEMGALLNPDRSPSGKSTVTLVGLSTDSKPTSPDIGNGSMFLEMDTGSIYFYNGDEWLEFAGNGGGSGGGSNVLVVNLDTNDYSLDKTYKQIHDSDFAVIREDWGDGGYGQPQYVTGVYFDTNDNKYHVEVFNVIYGSSEDYQADTENDYPVRLQTGVGD